MSTIEIIKNVRRELHMIPESSGHEIETRKYIKTFLKDNTKLEVIDYRGGIIALYNLGDFQNVIAFRADFDAVSMPGGMAAHLCGHDGHTAALLGVALELEKIKPERNVLLIFQPAEETGEGASAMADLLEEYPVSEIYGCHNLPGYSLGKVYTKFDTFACASCGMTFYIEGEPSHAAYPENGKSPIRVITELFNSIEETRDGSLFNENSFATLIGSNIGQKAFGTAAEKAEVWVTVRADSEKEFTRVRDYLEYTVRRACEREKLNYRVEIQDVFPATVNDQECVDTIIKKCQGELLNSPMRWSEDFGHFLARKYSSQGAFFGIGAGESAALHTKDYEYPDELLEYQIEAFIKLL